MVKESKVLTSASTRGRTADGRLAGLSGFTLVELSIVLVIIGLLIGGILVAQSMIETARVQSFIRELQQIDTAVTNFQTKYNSLPGDSSNFGCVDAENTCDDGFIEDSVGGGDPYNTYGAAYDNQWDAEAANFWPNLSASGFGGSDSYVPTITGSFKIGGTNSNAPKVPIGGAGAGIIVYAEPDWYGPYNFYVVSNWTQITATQIWGAQTEIIPAASALSVDLKIDDGKADTGIFFGPDEASNGRTCVGSSDSVYSTQAGAKCIVFYRVQAAGL